MPGLIIGPGFPTPPVGVSIPDICAAGTHTFVACGVCTTCRRTVPELAVLGLARPFPCSKSGIHVVVGTICIECRESVKVSA